MEVKNINSVTFKGAFKFPVADQKARQVVKQLWQNLPQSQMGVNQGEINLNLLPNNLKIEKKLVEYLEFHKIPHEYAPGEFTREQFIKDFVSLKIFG